MSSSTFYINVSGYQWKIYKQFVDLAKDYVWICSCYKLNSGQYYNDTREKAIAEAKAATKRLLEKKK